jgi:hypothetical protein
VIDPLFLLEGGTACVALQWDDPFSGSSNDYDLRLFLDDPFVLVAASEGPQTGTQEPVEFLCYENPGASAFFDITILNFSASGTSIFDMFVLCDSCAPLPDLVSGQPIHNFNTRCSSVPNNSDAGGGVVSLGAIDAGDPGSNSIEAFSSCGPTNDGRTKPDAVAIDGVSVTGNGGFDVPFFGTSAAAPHAAGVAALLLECEPSLTREGLRNALLNTAVDLGSNGPDDVFGHGRLDALAAGSSVGCAGVSLTPTPSATATATAGSTPTGSVTPSPTATVTPTATGGPTITPVPTSTPVPTWTQVPTWTPEPTWTPNVPPTATPTDTPPPPTSTPVTPPGDTSCDGRIDPTDAVLVLQFAAGMIPALPCLARGDTNGDGVTNPLDAALILQFSAGIISTLPP